SPATIVPETIISAIPRVVSIALEVNISPDYGLQYTFWQTRPAHPNLCILGTTTATGMSSTTGRLPAPSSKASVPHSKGATVQVDFGGQKVDVPKDGYYDRYRMNPDLKEHPKKAGQFEGGPTYAPNFYYRTSSVQLVFFAPLDCLRSKLPSPLEPITALPGYGLVVVTFYSYLVCDNDPYNEVSIAIVVRQPGQNSYSTTQLLYSMWNRIFYGYVVALPVNTDIARVRGVYGYQFPKWLANIDMGMDDHTIKADLSAIDGTLDLTLEAPSRP
ncbi:hypothetical protein TrVFT333_010655, partial [Trichoderma virens FT-333]